MSEPIRGSVLPEVLADALHAGAIVVVPNDRLARRLTEMHDDAQRASGLLAWERAAIVSWPRWQGQLWEDARAADAWTDPPRRITPIQSAHLWRSIVRADRGTNSPLIDEDGAAELAAEAWERVHAWGAGGESWRGFADDDGDAASFARWANRWQAATGRSHLVDAARVADVLAGVAPRVPRWRTLSILLAGFLELDPQQQRLQAALAAQGARFAHLERLQSAPGRIARATGTTPRDELARALAWARARALADPNATIGIAVDDLGARRAEVIALAEEILCPALRFPGHEDAPRPYDLSLGDALAARSIVATAIDLIAVWSAPQHAARVATLARSPYLPDGDLALASRARVERIWIDAGRSEISWREFVPAMAKLDADYGARLAAIPPPDAVPARDGAPAWTARWRELLDATGWPGDRALTSPEFQARRAFLGLLVEFAGLSVQESTFSRADAAAILQSMAATRIFQPEASGARIRIMGFLEAAPLPLDALWVTGLAADRWPAAPSPHPLLPVAWQRERDAPHASAAREREQAEAIFQHWIHSAPEIVLSSSRQVDDHPCEPAYWLVGQPALTPDDGAGIDTARAIRAAAPDPERVDDRYAPKLTRPETVRGGARLIEAQSDCPFQAFAQFRLGTQPWPDPVVGFTASERGTLAHAALAHFWRATRDHATLLAMDDAARAAGIARAVAGARSAIRSERWRTLPPAVANGESARLSLLLLRWIVECDLPRPAFAIAALEESMPLTLGGLALSLRLDRVDTLLGPDAAAAGVAIIDYKTGAAPNPSHWFDARPQAPQLALYALAQATADPDVAVRALAYGLLAPDRNEARGLVDDSDAWPALSTLASLRALHPADWPDAMAWWAKTLAGLASDHASGDALVAPRDRRATCRNCRRESLCRIAQADAPAGGNRGADADD